MRNVRRWGFARALLLVICLAGALAVAGPAAAATVTGTPGDDVLRGGAGADLLRGLGGNDQLDARGGDDRAHGGRGSDTLRGGKGDDRLYGGAGPDDLTGGTGADLLIGDARSSGGADVLDGGGGDDRLLGRAGADEISGGPGSDRLRGGSGPDDLRGGPGDDLILAGVGADRITHFYRDNENSTDSYKGGRGWDTLRLVISDDELEALGTTRQALRDHFDATAPGTVDFGDLGVDLQVTVAQVERLEIGPSARGLVAPRAPITMDGERGDWASIAGLDLTLESLRSRDEEPKEASVKVAHDGEFVYVLLEVVDDYDWIAADPHLSAASAIMWSIDPGAGPHMGAGDPSGVPSLGMVDIWHWELECSLGHFSGGSTSGPGDGDPGNDGSCNLDDEWSNNPFAREDDNGVGAENSLTGVWTHTLPVAGADGTWIFELRRPLQTGDEQDAQFSAGGTALLAVAYWDPDQSPTGWADSGHVQSSNRGWIDVTFAD